MIPIRSTLPLLLVAMAACSSSNSNKGPINSLNTTFTESTDTIEITNDNVAFSFPRDETYDRGMFVAGANPREGTVPQILAFSQTDDTFAAVLRNNAGGISADVFIGRTTDLGALPDGSATLAGTYIGTWSEDDPVTYRTYISGDAKLEVNFAAMTVSGSVTNRTSPLFDFGEFAGPDGDPILFSFSGELILDEAPLSADGTFSGAARSVETIDGVTTTSSLSGAFDGLLGGETASEGVGRIFLEMPEIPATTDTSFPTPGLPAFREVGVFAVGH